MATIIEISQFLRRFKLQASKTGIDFVNRLANRDGMAELGITVDDAEKFIKELTFSNYSKGSEADKDGSIGEVWIFGKEINSKQVYIKLKLDNIGAKCLSFHPAEFSLQQPFNLGGSS